MSKKPKKVGVRPRVKLSKQQKRIKKTQRQRQKKIKQLAKQLKDQHKQHQKRHQHRVPVLYVTKTGLKCYKFDPSYPLQAFKNPETKGWRLVKTCRLPSLSDMTLSVRQYNRKKDYFVLGSPDLRGRLHYSREELEPVIRNKKRRRMRDFLDQAAKKVSKQERA